MNHITRPTLTRTQLKWIVSALNHDIAITKKEIDQCKNDNSPIAAVGEVFILGRQNLVTILEDIINSDKKTIRIN